MKRSSYQKENTFDLFQSMFLLSSFERNYGALDILQGVWRIPSGEIDRAGSFAYHMSCCVHLVVDMLRDLKDFYMLLELSIQLRDMPEPDK